MKIIDPIEITEGMIVSSNLADEDYPVWAEGQTYGDGTKVRLGRTLYEALTDTADEPERGRLKHPPTWLRLGASNRWRLFDDKIGTQSTAEGAIELAIQSGHPISALTFFNLAGISLSARLEDPAEGVVWERSQSLVDHGVNNWYEYFFKPADWIEDVVIQGIPAYPNATLYLTIENIDELAAIGHLAIGTEIEIGVTCYGSTVGIKDYSRKETDEWGNNHVVERGFSKRASFDVVVDTSRVAAVQKLMARIRSKPVVWIGDESHEATILIGFYKEFETVIAGPSVSDAVISVEGLV